MKYHYCKLLGPRADFARTMMPDELQLMREHGAYLHAFTAKRWLVAFVHGDRI